MQLKFISAHLKESCLNFLIQFVYITFVLRFEELDVMIIGYSVRKDIGSLFDPLNGTFQLHSVESSPCLEVPAGMEMLKYAALYNNTWLPPTKLIVFLWWWSTRYKDI